MLEKRKTAAKAKPKAKGKAKAKAASINADRARKLVKRKDDGVVVVQEKPLPKAKKQNKSTPLSQIEEDVLDIIRAGRKGESVLDMIRAGKKANLARAKSLPRLPAEKKKAE